MGDALNGTTTFIRECRGINSLRVALPETNPYPLNTEEKQIVVLKHLNIVQNHSTKGDVKQTSMMDGETIKST